MAWCRLDNVHESHIIREPMPPMLNGLIPVFLLPLGRSILMLIHPLSGHRFSPLQVTSRVQKRGWVEPIENPIGHLSVMNIYVKS